MINFNTYFYSQLYRYFKGIVFTIFFIFIIYKIYENFNFFEEKILLNIPLILIIFFVHNIHHNFLNLRLFLLIKNCTNYIGSYFNWAQIFFDSLTFNILISHTGSVYRAVELKKRNVEFKQFLGLYYISFLGYLIVNILLINLEILFIDEVPQKFKLSVFIILLFTLLISVSIPRLSKIFISIFNFLKLELFKKIANISLIIIDFIKTSVQKSKTLLIVFVFSSISHFFEFLLFYLSYDLFMDQVNIEILIILFSISFMLDRIPILSNIPGLNETIFAIFSVPLGLYFNESFLIKLVLRFTGYFSVIFNFIIYKYLNYTNK